VKWGDSATGLGDDGEVCDWAKDTACKLSASQMSSASRSDKDPHS
jgi:hypothetical protein